MDFAREHGLVSGEARVFARNRLVVVTPAGNPARIRRLQDLARPGVKIVIAAESVPAGSYARAVIAKLAAAPGFPKGWERRVHANVVSQEENVRAVVGKVQLGEADAGFVYRSDVSVGGSRLVRVFDIVPQWNVIASYPIAPLGSSSSRELAQEFCSFVLAPEGRAVLERHGFLAPAGP
jgi:molybdate transport system substrate-binding protein